MSKFMRMIVFFDLPVVAANDRKAAAQFRKFLLKDGYHMIQFSVYTRVCNGMDAVKKHEDRLNSNLPSKGSVRLLTLTDKQYDMMKILIGSKMFDDEEMASDMMNFF